MCFLLDQFTQRRIAHDKPTSSHRAGRASASGGHCHGRVRARVSAGLSSAIIMMSYIEPASTFHCRRVTHGGRDARCRTAPRTLGAYAATVIPRLRGLAPYAAIVALPGGSLIALLLWLYRRQAATALGLSRESLPPTADQLQLMRL
jgi:hypothetical protein